MTRWMIRALCALVLLAVPAFAADEAPTEALCHVCRVMSGEEHMETVRATRAYEGVTYGFCSKECAEKFDAEPAAYVPPKFPRPAPGFSLTTLDGDTLTLDGLRGRVALVDFWATWCQPCRKSMPELTALHEKYADRGFTVVGISIDEDREKEVRKFLEKTPVAYPIAIDDTADPAWGSYLVKAVPTAFLVDREGQIVAQWTGRTVDAAALDARLEGMLKGD